MAKDKSKERHIEILDYEIDKMKELVKNWKKYGISQNKIDKLEAKQALKEAKKAEIEAS